MPHHQPDPARILNALAGDMPDADLLADLTDDQLADVGRIALQRRRDALQNSQDNVTVVGRIGAEYLRRKKDWREAAEMLDMPHMTLYRWAQPFLGSA